jgi:hypothetical protein
MTETETTTINQLVNATRLLELLFDKTSRPSLRWLQGQMADGSIPYIKTGRLVRFDPTRVRDVLDTAFTVNSMEDTKS